MFGLALANPSDLSLRITVPARCQRNEIAKKTIVRIVLRKCFTDLDSFFGSSCFLSGFCKDPFVLCLIFVFHGGSTILDSIVYAFPRRQTDNFEFA